MGHTYSIVHIRTYGKSSNLFKIFHFYMYKIKNTAKLNLLIQNLKNGMERVKLPIL